MSDLTAYEHIFEPTIIPEEPFQSGNTPNATQIEDSTVFIFTPERVSHDGIDLSLKPIKPQFTG